MQKGNLYFHHAAFFNILEGYTAHILTPKAFFPLQKFGIFKAV